MKRPACQPIILLIFVIKIANWDSAGGWACLHWASRSVEAWPYSTSGCRL